MLSFLQILLSFLLKLDNQHSNNRGRELIKIKTVLLNKKKTSQYRILMKMKGSREIGKLFLKTLLKEKRNSTKRSKSIKRWLQGEAKVSSFQEMNQVICNLEIQISHLNFQKLINQSLVLSKLLFVKASSKWIKISKSSIKLIHK